MEALKRVMFRRRHSRASAALAADRILGRATRADPVDANIATLSGSGAAGSLVAFPPKRDTDVPRARENKTDKLSAVLRYGGCR